MSAFAARKAKRSGATQDTFADITNGHSPSEGLPRHQPGKDGGETLPPRKKHKTETRARTRTNPTIQLQPPAGLPPKPQEGYPASLQGNDKSSSTAPNPADNGSGSSGDQIYSNLATEAQDEAPDSDYGLDVDDSESEVRVRGDLPIQQLSRFVAKESELTAQNDSDTEWHLILGDGDILTLIGQYDIWVRRGAISILGAVLRPSSRLHRVFAPSTHSLPPIRPLQDPYCSSQRPTELTILACGDGIRSLKLVSTKFRRIWNHKHVPTKRDVPAVDLSRRSFALLITSADDRHKRPLRLLQPSDDRQTLINILLAEKAMAPTSIMICGPKGSGKSTFGRMLVNAMITRSASTSHKRSITQTDGVAFLDLDPGQPEFSPPGELSLIHLRSCNLGPPFTHPAIAADNGDRLVRAHHYGALSPKNDPGYYIKCARDLFGRYQELLAHFPSCPLVVNSAGWVQGAGLEVLLEIIKLRRISDVVYTSTRGPQEVVEALAEAADKVRIPIHYVTSQGSEIATRTAADFRVMQTLSYFHLNGFEAGNLRWNSNPLSEQIPLVVHWAGDEQALFAVMFLSNELDPETMFIALNGCTVGLVVIEDDQAIPDDSRPDVSGNPFEEFETTNIGDVSMSDGATESPPFTFSAPRTNSMSDNDSDSGNLADARSIQGLDPVEDYPTNHLEHPSIARNTSDIPYISAGATKRFSSPLDPTGSYSLGQAIIRGIDPKNKCFHLLTPVPSATLTDLHRQRKQIVLVRGRLDMPTWANRESWEKGAALRRRIRKQDPEAADRFDAQDAREWAERTPRVSALHERVKSVSARVWRVRRDLKMRASGDDTD